MSLCSQQSQSTVRFQRPPPFNTLCACQFDSLPVDSGAGERVRQVVIKAAKVQRRRALNSEIKELAQLDDPNIVRILGFCFGISGPDMQQKSNMLLMDYCCTDLKKLALNR